MMDQSSLAAAPPPIPRRSRERERGRPQSPDRSQSSRPRDRSHNAAAPAPAVARASSNDREYGDVFADWTTRDRELYARRYLRDQQGDDQATPLPPASPEVISSLITSLSTISRPVSKHFDSPTYLTPIGQGSPLALSAPASPTGGSFGVDYGAYSQPSLKNLQEEDVPLEELAASAPVIRTSKPPSGLSPLTAPRSPKSPSARDSGFKGLLSRRSSGGVSRPSSRGSASGAESIGKLSVERSQEPLSPLSPGTDGLRVRSQPSYDNWGNKKGTRNQRGLMYMSSRERLREKEAEKKRASIGAASTNLNRLSSTSAPPTPRLDPLSADSVINEEPNGDFAIGNELSPAADITSEGVANPRLIPARDSSLRKSGSAKRASARNSRTSKRDSDGAAYGTIPELEEQGTTRAARVGDANNRLQPPGHGQGQSLDPMSLSASLPQENRTSLARLDPASAGPSSPSAIMFSDTEVDEGAPFPAVAQGRRRDREASAEYRRRSGHLTPDPFGGGYTSEGGNSTIKTKRSSAKLKRRSGAASPAPEPHATEPQGSAPAANNRLSDQPHVAYERPRSADSIDDSVESYLCSPRLSQKIKHPQTGRVISFSEVGDPNGSAVFCCVGMGLTRYITAFYDELALTLKLRLITPDRPGVGDSEAYAEGTATPLGWPGTFPDPIGLCMANPLQTMCTRSARPSKSPSSRSSRTRLVLSTPSQQPSACPSTSAAAYTSSPRGFPPPR